MFTSLAIQNFRAFTDLKVDSVDRVNLIAGKNDTGKTALLEAAYLHCNPTNARASLNMARLRGIREPKIEDVAEWLFFDAGIRSAAKVSTEETSGLRRTSELRLVDARDTSDPDFDRIRELVKGINPDYLFGSGRAVVMKYTDSSGLDLVGLTSETFKGGFTTSPSFIDRRAPLVPVVYVNSRGQVATTEEDPEPVVPAENLLFDHLDAEGRQGEVLEPLQHLEPRLEGLSFNLFNGKTVIHGHLEGVSRKVPLPLMGEGVRRLLLTLTAIANAKGGVALIDEIDDGLHYSVLPDVWRAIGEAARRLDVQVFAATHSWECIRTAHEAFSQNGPYDLRLHRLDRIDGNVRAVTYDQETLETSIGLNWEVR